MIALVFFGVLSMAFTVVMTAYAYSGTGGTGQSRRESIIESWFNIVIGFSINFVMNMLVFPLVGANITAGQNFWIGCIFTGVSVLRTYAIRRWFNARLHAVAQRLAAASIR